MKKAVLGKRGDCGGRTHVCNYIEM